MHNYIRDPQSGAGNCKECAHPREYVNHPHIAVPAAADKTRCVCGLKIVDDPDDWCHLAY